nr:hypothetical protein CFP56_49732 [Quercus suber]
MSRVPDNPLIRIYRQGGACQVVSRRVLDDRWVPNDPLVLDNPLIRGRPSRWSVPRDVREAKVLDDRWVPDDPLVLDDPLIRDDCQGEMCHMVLGKGGTCRVMLGKVPNDRWVLDDPLVPNDQLIRNDYQGRMCRTVSRKGGACHAMSGKVPNDRWVPDDPLINDNYQGEMHRAVSHSLCDRRYFW